MANVADIAFAYSFRTGSLTASAGSQLLISENPDRKNVEITNNTPDPIFIRFRDGLAASNLFSIRVASYANWRPEKPPVTASLHVACGGSSGTVVWYEVS